MAIILALCMGVLISQRFWIRHCCEHSAISCIDSGLLFASWVAIISITLMLGIS